MERSQQCRAQTDGATAGFKTQLIKLVKGVNKEFPFNIVESFSKINKKGNSWHILVICI